MEYIDIAIHSATVLGTAYILFAWFEFGFRKEQPIIAPELPIQQEEEPDIEEITVKPAMARTMPKAATAVVVPEGKAIKDMTSRELRALCNERGIRWNRASKIKHGAHMTSAEMRAALQG